jgi:hypothetical protein
MHVITGFPTTIQSFLARGVLKQPEADERIQLALKFTEGLKILDLNNTDLWDDQLIFITKKFFNLEVLNIRVCPNLTLEGYESLKDTKLKILYVSESSFNDDALDPDCYPKLALKVCSLVPDA